MIQCGSNRTVTVTLHRDQLDPCAVPLRESPTGHRRDARARSRSAPRRFFPEENPKALDVI